MTQEKKQANKGLSLALIVLGALGIVLGVVAIIYSVHGINVAFEATDLEAIQSKCQKTFATETAPGWKSVDTRECLDEKFTCTAKNGGWGATCKAEQYCSDGGTSCTDCPFDDFLYATNGGDPSHDNRYVGECPKTTEARDAKNPQSCYSRCYGKLRDDYDAKKPKVRLGTYMCGHHQFLLGCSYSTYKALFGFASLAGIWATSIGSIFVIIASIPILANGLFGFFNNEILARVSGGFGVACSVIGFCGAFSCMIATVIASFISKAISDTLKELIAGANGVPCSSACKESRTATAELGEHVVAYYTVITVLAVILMLIAIVDIVIASVSCCYWKADKTQNKVAAQPAQQPVVAEPTVVVAATVVEAQ